MYGSDAAAVAAAAFQAAKDMGATDSAAATYAGLAAAASVTESGGENPFPWPWSRKKFHGIPLEVLEVHLEVQPLEKSKLFISFSRTMYIINVRVTAFYCIPKPVASYSRALSNCFRSNFALRYPGISSLLKQVWHLGSAVDADRESELPVS